LWIRKGKVRRCVLLGSEKAVGSGQGPVGLFVWHGDDNKDRALTLEKNYLHHRYKVSVCILLHVLILDLLFNHNFLKFIYFIIRKWI
jgi:hypothetical protein